MFLMTKASPTEQTPTPTLPTSSHLLTPRPLYRNLRREFRRPTGMRRPAEMRPTVDHGYLLTTPFALSLSKRNPLRFELHSAVTLTS